MRALKLSDQYHIATDASTKNANRKKKLHLHPTTASGEFGKEDLDIYLDKADT